jgi:hypothetical protein
VSITQAQEALPYYTEFDQSISDTTWEQYRLGPAMDAFQEWNFNSDQLNHNYPVGGEEITNDWMVSPEFDFSNGASIDSLRYSFGGFGFPMGEDTIALYLLNGSRNPAEASSATVLKLFTDDEYNPDNIWKTLNDVEIPPISGESYIAFRYQTIVNWLDASFDDLNILAPPLSASNKENANSLLNIYPNPTNDFFQISGGASTLVKINIYNSAGTLVKSEVVSHENQRIDISQLPGGIYTVHSTSRAGAEAVKKLMVAY